MGTDSWPHVCTLEELRRTEKAFKLVDEMIDGWEAEEILLKVMPGCASEGLQ